MGKAKMVLMTALATMAIATTAAASVPSGYDTWVNVEKPTAQEVRTNGYCKNPVKSFGGDFIAWPVNIEKPTPEEVRTNGYCKNPVKSFGGDFIAWPDNGPLTITEAMLDEMFKGNN